MQRLKEVALRLLYCIKRNNLKSTTGAFAPIDAGSTLWRSRIPTTSNSRGYEIEKMPVSGSTWLHLQRQPGNDTAPDSP